MTTVDKTQLQVMKAQSVTPTFPALMKFDKEITLPAHIDKTQFMLSARTIFTRVRDIGSCDPGSIVGALVQTAVLGLDPQPDLGMVYYIPRKIGGSTQLEFKLGYRGIIEILYRNKDITKIDSEVVYENDFFEVDKFADPPIKHRPNYKGDRGKPYAVYALIKFRGEYITDVMTSSEIEGIKNRSDAKSSPYSPWNAKEETVRLEMWKKSVIRRLSKLLPKNTIQGLETDNAIIPEDALRSNGEAVEVDYSEVQSQVEYSNYEEQTETQPAQVENVYPEEYQDTPQVYEEAKQAVTAANDSPLRLGDKIMKRIESGEVTCNLKIYKSGQFGAIYVKAKDASYEDKGTKVLIQTEAQVRRIEELAVQKEAGKKPQPQPSNVADDLPF